MTAPSRITRLNPPALHATPGYHHVTIVEAGRTAHLAGQCPLDSAGALVGPNDLSAQTRQVVANAQAALDAIDATPHDVVRTVIYVVSESQPTLAATWRELAQSPLGPAFTSASTLLGVAQLGYPGQLIEIDLTVAVGASH
jgi:enamine deaminase RidA (YjgF/YER057c/UK114 family)